MGIRESSNQIPSKRERSTLETTGGSSGFSYEGAAHKRVEILLMPTKKRLINLMSFFMYNLLK